MVINQDLQQAKNAIRRKRFEEAVTLLSRILAIRPNDVQARWLLVQTLQSQQKKEKVLVELQSLLIHVKRDLSAIDRIASFMLQGRYSLKPVLRAYKNYLAHQPESASAAFNHAWYLGKDGQFEAAIYMYKRSLELGINAPEEVHLNIANIYMDQLHNHKEARAHLLKALAKQPKYANAYFNLGNLSEQEGNREEAAGYFEQCLAIDPDNHTALARLADAHRFVEKGDPLLVRLELAAQKNIQSDLQFALGKAHEQLANHELAWQHFTRGNDKDKRTFPTYSQAHTEAFFNQIKTQCSGDWYSKHKGVSKKSVFICGMFRTGSTLLEQILNAHPGFVAGGESEFFPRLVARELPEYPQGIQAIKPEQLQRWKKEHQDHSRKLFNDNKSRLTDKRPDNFLNIGLIKAVLPSAKIIVTERDWHDVATSIYSMRLGPGQNYATSLKNIRHYIKLQKRLVDHWETILGPDLIRIRYEDLVSRPRETVFELLNELGEEWDERCLSFHKLGNAVKTASVWQVREPFHTRSIGRWKNYIRQFEDVFSTDLSD
jgi:Flp pilus assembly protein TadD